MIKVERISKSFGATQALREVCFEIKSGSVHGLVGENGAGKSTLMKVLMGIHQSDSGEIYLDGKPVSILGPEQANELGFRIVFQEIALCANLSIMENLFLGAERTRFGLMNFGEMEERAREVLEMVGLDFWSGVLVGELSVAEKQMVQIARAILYEPRLIIFDEPTSALTRDYIESLFRIIRGLHNKGVTVLYISHKLEEIFEVADMVTVLRDGRHIGTFAVEEVNEARLVQMMVGRELDLSVRRKEVKAGEVLLKVEGLSGDRFEGVGFEVRAGEIVGISGLVGSGRTELVESIFGVRRIKSGRVFLKGREVTGRSVLERIKSGMALVPEDRQISGLIFSMVLKQNLSLPGVVLGNRELGGIVVLPGSEADFARRAIEKLRIVVSGVDAEMMSLSGGNQQKVVVGKWLMLGPEVFIMDEPTRGIDVGAKAEIHNLIRGFADKGNGMLVVSSELPELLALSDRILVMREGRIRGEVCGDRACEEEIMRLAVGGINQEGVNQ